MAVKKNTTPKSRPSLTQARLKELLCYNPDTGVFTWRIRTHGRKGVYNPGDIAGFVDSHKGYIRLGVDGVKYNAHRLAWLYVYGVWPENGVDHKDTIRSHNWISNLRPATHLQNNQNQRKAHRNNKSGFLGVSPSEKAWKSQIKINGKSVYLGWFRTPEAAHAAYLEAKAKYHPFQTIV